MRDPQVVARAACQVEVRPKLPPLNPAIPHSAAPTARSTFHTSAPHSEFGFLSDFHLHRPLSYSIVKDRNNTNKILQSDTMSITILYILVLPANPLAFVISKGWPKYFAVGAKNPPDAAKKKAAITRGLWIKS